MLEYFWDKDAWLVRQKTKIVLVILGVLFVSMVMSCQELRYTVSGKTVDAAMTSRVENTIEHGERLTYRVVGYTYMDGSVVRQRFVKEPVDWPLASEKSIKVQYIPGRDQSRFYGETNKVWVTIFLGSLAAAVVAGIFVAKAG